MTLFSNHIKSFIQWFIPSTYLLAWDTVLSGLHERINSSFRKASRVLLYEHGISSASGFSDSYQTFHSFSLDSICKCINICLKMDIWLFPQNSDVGHFEWKAIIKNHELRCSYFCDPLRPHCFVPHQSFIILYAEIGSLLEINGS